MRIRSAARAGLALCVGLALATAAAARSPGVNYMVNCQGCHLANGEGIAGKVPVMRGHVADFLRVSGGREFLARVPGVANSPLADDELADLLNWLVAKMGPAVPRDFQPYSPLEVRALRARRFQDVRSSRSALIAAIATLKAQPNNP